MLFLYVGDHFIACECKCCFEVGIGALHCTSGGTGVLGGLQQRLLVAAHYLHVNAVDVVVARPHEEGHTIIPKCWR